MRMCRCVVVKWNSSRRAYAPEGQFHRWLLRPKRFDHFESNQIKEPFQMSRYTAMTMGFLLIFLGTKLHLVDSYTLTPRATKFYTDRFQSSGNGANGGNPLTNSAYGNNYASGNNYGSSNYGSGNYGSGNNYGSGTSSIPQYNPPTAYGGSGFNSWGSYPNSYSSNNQNPYQTAGYQSGSNVNSYLASYNNSNINQASVGNLGPQKTVKPPSWICWPVLFLGAVLVIHGLFRRRG